MAELLVSVIMGSRSDWETMQHCVRQLEDLGIACEPRALSAHRTPDALFDYLKDAESRGAQVFIAAAGGAAHLPGVVAAKTTRPVIGVPMKAWALDGLDSLLSIVQMPGGIPVATMAIGKAGAVNAALFAASILANGDAKIAEAIRAFRNSQAKKVIGGADPRAPA